MDAKTLLASSAFMMSAALIVSLVTNFTHIFPGDVLTAPVRSNMTIILLAAMLTLSLSRIPARNLSPAKDPKGLLRAVMLGLVISAVIPALGYLLLKDTEWGVEAVGLVFIAATPFAASVAPLSFILRGDLEHALRSTIIIYVLALVWIPFVIWLLIGKMVDMTSVVITVVEIIGIPLILSRFLTKVKIDKDVMAMVLNCVIFILVWLSVSSTAFPPSLAIILGFAVIALMRTFGLGLAVEVVEKRSGVHWSQRVTDILMTSYKNKGIAIALCAAIMGPLGLAGQAMVAIATSIIIEICWVIFMDSVLFSKKRMERELAAEGSEVVDP